MASQVIEIGQFAGGSFGVAGHPNESYMYYAVEGDRGHDGFPRFASRHRAAVEQHARKIDAEAAVPHASHAAGATSYVQRILDAMRNQLVEAKARQDRSGIKTLERQIAELSQWPSWQPLPEYATAVQIAR